MKAAKQRDRLSAAIRSTMHSGQWEAATGDEVIRTETQRRFCLQINTLNIMCTKLILAQRNAPVADCCSDINLNFSAAGYNLY